MGGAPGMPPPPMNGAGMQPMAPYGAQIGGGFAAPGMVGGMGSGTGNGWGQNLPLLYGNPANGGPLSAGVGGMSGGGMNNGGYGAVGGFGSPCQTSQQQQQNLPQLQQNLPPPQQQWNSNPTASPQHPPQLQQQWNNSQPQLLQPPTHHPPTQQPEQWRQPAQQVPLPINNGYGQSHASQRHGPMGSTSNHNNNNNNISGGLMGSGGGGRGGNMGNGTCSLSDEDIAKMIQQREICRQQRDYGTADNIRDTLRRQGVQLFDRENKWKTTDGRTGIIPGWQTNNHSSKNGR